MGEVKYIERAVISYCDIPEELTENSWMMEYGTNCYVDFYADPNCPIWKWIVEQYPELEGEKVLIEIDY